MQTRTHSDIEILKYYVQQCTYNSTQHTIYCVQENRCFFVWSLKSMHISYRSKMIYKMSYAIYGEKILSVELDFANTYWQW